MVGAKLHAMHIALNHCEFVVTLLGGLSIRVYTRNLKPLLIKKCKQTFANNKMEFSAPKLLVHT